MIDPTHIRWIFFDVGDTLLDERESMSDWCGQVADVLTRRCERRTTSSDVWTAREQAYRELAPDVLTRIVEILQVPFSAAELREHAKYRPAMERPFHGATDVLNRLGSRYRLGVIANQSAGTQERLCGHGWRGVFQVCISSAEENLHKPDPAIFHLALTRAGCRADQAVMIGDRIDNDVAPARSVGMKTVRVRQGLSAVQEPINPSQTPDMTVARLGDLPPLFRC